MTKSQYASLRQQLPSPGLTTAAGGNLTAGGTLYFALSGLNHAGLNLLSIPLSVTYAAGDQIEVTIPTEAREAGEDIREFILSASPTNDFPDFVQVARYPGFDTDGITLTPLPATIIFSEDEHLVLDGSVTLPADLPVSPSLLDGAIREVTDLATLYEYRAESTRVADGSSVLDAVVGRWELIGSRSTYLAETTNPGGSDQSLAQVTTPLGIPTYPVDGSVGTPVDYWLVNNDPATIPAGVRVGMAISVNSQPKSQLFDGLLKLEFLGYVYTATGELDIYYDDGITLLAGIGVQVDYQARKTALALPKDLPSGWAYALAVSPVFSEYQLFGRVPDNAQIAVEPFFYAQAGAYNEAGMLLGNLIAAESDRRRLVPELGLLLTALQGSGLVNSYSFQGVGPSLVTGLASDTANQIAAINANGSVFMVAELPTNAAQRALISTLAGTSNPSPQSAYAAVALNDGLTVTLNHPSDGTTGTIRPDYPDVIAGNTQGAFNPDTARVYVQQQSTGEIREFVGFATISAATQELFIDDWTTGYVIPAIPTQPDPAFSLYAPGPASFVPQGTGTFPADSYAVSFAYVYDGGQVTGIDHSVSSGNIYEAGGTLAELFAHVGRIDNPHQVSKGQLELDTQTLILESLMFG